MFKKQLIGHDLATGKPHYRRFSFKLWVLGVIIGKDTVIFNANLQVQGPIKDLKLNKNHHAYIVGNRFV